MKQLQLIKETKFNDEPFYFITFGGSYVTGSYEKEKIEGLFKQLQEDTSLLTKKKEVIKEINIDIKEDSDI